MEMVSWGETGYSVNEIRDGWSGTRGGVDLLSKRGVGKYSGKLDLVLCFYSFLGYI
jgi:hypothetical protein